MRRAPVRVVFVQVALQHLARGRHAADAPVVRAGAVVVARSQRTGEAGIVLRSTRRGTGHVRANHGRIHQLHKLLFKILPNNAP